MAHGFPRGKLATELGGNACAGGNRFNTGPHRLDVTGFPGGRKPSAGFPVTRIVTQKRRTLHNGAIYPEKALSIRLLV